MIVSIVTINYNNLTGLKKTFESVIRQTFTDYEWIIIDGGSTDGSKLFIEQHQDRFSFWCSEPDGGIYQALNKGVKYAKGEYINFLNSGDCFIDSNVLLQVFKTSHTGDILYGDSLYIGKTGKELHVFPEHLTYNWLSFTTINHQATFTKREVFRHLSFDAKYKVLADRKFWMECMLHNFTFEHLPFTVSLYDYTGFSVSNKEKWAAEKKEIFEEITPIGLQENLRHGEIYELHSDLWRAYQILEKHGPCRKILHLTLNLLIKLQSKDK